METSDVKRDTNKFPEGPLSFLTPTAILDRLVASMHSAIDSTDFAVKAVLSAPGSTVYPL